MPLPAKISSTCRYGGVACHSALVALETGSRQSKSGGSALESRRGRSGRTLEFRRRPPASNSTRAPRLRPRAIGAVRRAVRAPLAAMNRPAHPCFRGAGRWLATGGTGVPAPEDSRDGAAYHTACLVFVLACKGGERSQSCRSCGATWRGPTALRKRERHATPLRRGPPAGAECPPLPCHAMRRAPTRALTFAPCRHVWESPASAFRPTPRRWLPKACQGCRAGA